jgi:2-aminoadipate transaminase
MNQLIASDFLHKYSEDYWRRIRAAYKERRDQAVYSVERHIGAMAQSCTNPQGGFFLWLEVDQKIDTEKLLPFSVNRFGVAFAPGAPFFAYNPASNAMRLSFSNLSLEMIERGIKSLGKALQSS